MKKLLCAALCGAIIASTTVAFAGCGSSFARFGAAARLPRHRAVYGCFFARRADISPAARRFAARHAAPARGAQGSPFHTR